MPKPKRLSPRKEPTQQRSIELRNAILEAATYVLKKEGAYGFTTNKVADKAGVNIASLYQYYPNKEALLFHLVEIEWNTTFEATFPIFKDKNKTPRARLHLFIEKFYETEMAEFELRQAMAAAGVLIENTQDYQNLTAKAEEIFMEFLTEAFGPTSKTDLQRKSDFIQNVIFSFSESIQPKSLSEAHAEAKMMSEMLCQYFKIKD